MGQWPAAHHSLAPEEGVNCEAGHQEGDAGCLLDVGRMHSSKIMGNSLSRAAESKVWSSETLHHIQLQYTDAQLKTKRFEDLKGVNSKKSGYAVSSGIQHGEGSFRVKQARKKPES